eukprot:3174405-Rhodomonas_salina.3
MFSTEKGGLTPGLSTLGLALLQLCKLPALTVRGASAHCPGKQGSLLPVRTEALTLPERSAHCSLFLLTAHCSGTQSSLPRRGERSLFGEEVSDHRQQVRPEQVVD